MSTWVVTEGITRIEQLEIPEDVLREAICNAIVHRDYMGVHTQMKVYDDRITIWNDGKLPDGIDQEKLFAEHASQPRNRNLANAFYKAGFIETWGRGINKIRQGLKSAQLQEPKIENNASGTLLTIYRNVGVDGTVNGGNMAVMKLTERQSSIVSCLAKNPDIAARQVAVIMDVPQRTIERELSVLQKMAILHREGSPRTGKWVIENKSYLK